MSKEKVHRNKLNKDEFHQWRSSIYELHEAKHLAQLAELKLKLMQKEVDILNLQSHLFVKDEVDGSKKRAEAAKVQYDKIKESLEKSLGYSLNGAIIDEITLEVKNLNDLKK